MDRNNIILIGLPGCGKSTLSNELSNILKIEVIDLDKILISEIGSLQIYINKHGNDAFKIKEEQICRNAISNLHSSIISPGGSIIFYENLMNSIKSKSIVIFLDVDLNVILERTKNFKDRGVVLPNDKTLDINEKYKLMYSIRSLLCKKYCDIHIKGNNIKANNIIDKLMTFKSKELYQIDKMHN
jgi:shikimate kinase